MTIAVMKNGVAKRKPGKKKKKKKSGFLSLSTPEPLGLTTSDASHAQKGRMDCVENLTRQRHDRDQTENQQNAATVDSCFKLVGSRQHGVAQQKVEK